MSIVARVPPPTAAGDLAAMVFSALSAVSEGAPQDLSAAFDAFAAATSPPPTAPSPERFPFGPTGLGTSAARILPTVPDPVRPPLSSLDGLNPGALLVAPPEIVEDDSMPALFGPGAVRDDPSLGEEVNNRLIDWADEVGIYAGQLERVRGHNFGRLMMLAHPATDDPDRLLAAGRCALAEWATDDHFLDDESLGADPKAIARRLGMTHGSIEPTDMPVRYVRQLEELLADEPVAVAYRTAMEHLAPYASPTQIRRLRDQLTLMFMSYNHEASWQTDGRVPPVWEYLVHRNQNNFVPCIELVDAMAGYELPSSEAANRPVRRLVVIAGNAMVALNDLVSIARESDTDTDLNLPKVIAHEDGCSLEDAAKRTAHIHNELMRTFVEEAVVVGQLGSPALRRFLVDVWAWLGGARAWHSTSPRYSTPLHS